MHCSRAHQLIDHHVHHPLLVFVKGEIIVFAQLHFFTRQPPLLPAIIPASRCGVVESRDEPLNTLYDRRCRELGVVSQRAHSNRRENHVVSRLPDVKLSTSDFHKWILSDTQAPHRPRVGGSGFDNYGNHPTDLASVVPGLTTTRHFVSKLRPSKNSPTPRHATEAESHRGLFRSRLSTVRIHHLRSTDLCARGHK